MTILLTLTQTIVGVAAASRGFASAPDLIHYLLLVLQVRLDLAAYLLLQLCQFFFINYILVS